MSHTSAIAAVTATLHRLIETDISQDEGTLAEIVQPTSEIRCTTLPLDQANEENKGHNRLNIFLYHTEVSAAFRNMDISDPKGSSPPPLAINLYYLLTAYGEDHNKLIDHLLLGRAMRMMHDLPQLSRSEIQKALPVSRLHQQVEKVRISPQPMTIDELSKLWSAFQTQYRISAAYEVSVVLIDSRRAQPAPLPVLKRGPDDRGVDTLVSAFPELHDIRPLSRPIIGEKEPWTIPLSWHRLAAQLGDTLELRGQSLAGDEVSLQFRHSLRPEIVHNLLPKSITTEKMTVQLPDNVESHTAWPAGFYTVAAIINKTKDQPAYTTGQTVFALAPRLNLEPLLADRTPAMRDNSGNITLPLSSQPHFFPQQQIALLLGEHLIMADSPSGQTAHVRFRITNVPPGQFNLLRLRVDGVDSSPIKPVGSTLVFDVDQTIMLTAPPLILDMDPPQLGGNGVTRYSITSNLMPHEEQTAVLLLDGHEFTPLLRNAVTDPLTFDVINAPVGDHPIQLRFGEVVSPPVTWTANGLEFEPIQADLLQVTPHIKQVALPENRIPGGVNTVTVHCASTIQPAQQVTLKLNEQEFPAEPHQNPTNLLLFDTGDLAQGEYVAQLHGDGLERDVYKKLALGQGKDKREGIILNPLHKVTL